MRYIIVTGASKGLGEALVKCFLSTENHVIGVARAASHSVLSSLAKEQRCSFTWVSLDLGKISDLQFQFESKVLCHMKSDATECVLINNAGMLGDIDLFHRLEAANIASVINLNLTSPMILTNAFMKHVNKNLSSVKERKIMNISSGASRNPYFLWNPYCTSKAGLDHFSRCVALEQAKEEHGFKAVSVAPGIIATDMQAGIRNAASRAEVAHKEHLERFVTLHDTGQLMTPIDCAKRLKCVLLNNTWFGENVVFDIRHDVQFNEDLTEFKPVQ